MVHMGQTTVDSKGPLALHHSDFIQGLPALAKADLGLNHYDFIQARIELADLAITNSSSMVAIEMYLLMEAVKMDHTHQSFQVAAMAVLREDHQHIDFALDCMVPSIPEATEHIILVAIEHIILDANSL